MISDEVYDRFDELIRSSLLTLRDIILSHDGRISEMIKYGMPSFCIAKRPVCYLWADKKNAEPYILFVNGQKMTSSKLEIGDRKRMAIYRLDPTKDFDLNEIKLLLDESISLHDVK